MAINFLVSLLKKNWNNVPWGNYPRDSMIDGCRKPPKIWDARDAQNWGSLKYLKVVPLELHMS